MYFLFFLLLVKMTFPLFTNSHWLIGCSLQMFSLKIKKAPIEIEPTTSILDGRCPCFYLVVFRVLLRGQLYLSLYDLLQRSVAVELFFFCFVWGVCDTADILASNPDAISFATGMWTCAWIIFLAFSCSCGRRMTDATWCHSLSIIPNKMGNLVRN